VEGVSVFCVCLFICRHQLLAHVTSAPCSRDIAALRASLLFNLLHLGFVQNLIPALLSRPCWQTELTALSSTSGGQRVLKGKQTTHDVLDGQERHFASSFEQAHTEVVLSSAGLRSGWQACIIINSQAADFSM